MNKHTLITLSVLATLAFSGCRNDRVVQASGPDMAAMEVTGNAVYYWKTRFELKPSETAFLQENDIKRIYLRYFDVDYERNPVTH